MTKHLWLIRGWAFAGLLGVAVIPALAEEEAAEDNSPAALFEKLDADKDGKLTKEEVGSERERFFNRLVRVGDKNEDGALTKEEFLAASQPAERPAQPGNPGTDNRRPGFGGSPEEMFKRMDQNGDGKLTLSEFPEPFRDRVKPLFERAGKEELSLAEYREAMVSMARNAGDRSREEFFKRLDTDGDGKITLAEVPEQGKSAVRQMLQRAGKAETDSITLEDYRKMAGMARPATPPSGFGGFSGVAALRILDSNRDGKLSKEELAQAVERFDRLDQNGDGQLDNQELTGFNGFGGRPGNPGTPPDAGAFVDRMFAELDKDKDGKITQEEAANMPGRAKERFQEWDRNNDGEATREEVAAYMKIAMQRFNGQRPNTQRPGDRSPNRPNQRPKSDD